LSGEAKENHEKSQSKQPIFESRKQRGASQMQSMFANTSTAMFYCLS